MATTEIQVLAYCDELVSTNEQEGTQLRKVIAVMPKHVWVYVLTYTVEKGKRIQLPYDCPTISKAITYLSRAVETNNSILSYEIFGETVRKEKKDVGRKDETVQV